MSKFIHIDKVGVELEGGWETAFQRARRSHATRKPGKTIPWNLSWHEDGSVRVYDDFIRGNGRNLWEGEGVCNPPQEPHRIMSWIKHNHPNWVNNSCGLHVHISFKKLSDYESLLENNFITYFQESMEKWGRVNEITYTPFWERLKGTNRYCQKNYKDTSQCMINYTLSKLKQDLSYSKYYQLNFSAWRKYNTIECRVLPMFPDPKQSAYAVYSLLELFENYLKSLPKQNPIVKVIKISESLKVKLETMNKNQERVIYIENNKGKDSIFSIEESESLIDDVVIRTTNDPTLRNNLEQDPRLQAVRAYMRLRTNYPEVE